MITFAPLHQPSALIVEMDDDTVADDQKSDTMTDTDASSDEELTQDD